MLTINRTTMFSQQTREKMDTLKKFAFLNLTVMLVIFMEIIYIQNQNYPYSVRLKPPVSDRKQKVRLSKRDGGLWNLPSIGSGVGNVQDSGPIPVLVLTYMRSGSTLIGDILQRYDNSTYAFEPLRFIEEDIIKSNSVTFLNGTRRVYTKEDLTVVMAEMVYRWFTCDVQKINIRDLESMMLQYSRSYGYYLFCIVKGRERFQTLPRPYIIRMCLKFLERTCRSRKVMIIKTIRLEMTSVELLLKWLPGLKVVHLIRDPRGKLSSQLKLEKHNSSLLPSIASSHCKRMLSDIMLGYRLNRQYPNRIRILRYERFSNDSIQKTKMMFKFLNLNFTSSILEYVKAITLNKEVKNNCRFCIKRTDASLVSSKWRLNLSFDFVQKIDRACRRLYVSAGFVAMDTLESLRNLSIPSQVDALKFMTL